MASHSSILAWVIPWTESLVGTSPWGCKESDTTEQLTYISNWTLELHSSIHLATLLPKSTVLIGKAL